MESRVLGPHSEYERLDDGVILCFSARLILTNGGVAPSNPGHKDAEWEPSHGWRAEACTNVEQGIYGAKGVNLLVSCFGGNVAPGVLTATGPEVLDCAGVI